jgi:hypothetical protein
MHKKLRTINNQPMTKIMPPMDNYISWQNTVEKNEDLWVPSSSLGGLLSSLMESSSYNGRKMENDEENQCIFPQEVSGMAIAMMLEYSKEKRGFSREN